MYGSSGSKFFRTTTGIQSGPDAFDKSRLVMAFLTNLGLTEIGSFRLVLEGKIDNEIPQSSRLELNPKSFLKIRPTQKEGLPSHKLQDHAFE